LLPSIDIENSKYRPQRQNSEINLRARESMDYPEYVADDPEKPTDRFLVGVETQTEEL